MTALYCPTAEDLGLADDQPAGCGVTWTPDHDIKPRHRPDETCRWAWCPDCKLPIPEE